MDAKKLKRKNPGALAERARGIKLIAMDVDGVLTGGEIIVLQSGEELKFFNAKDRLVLAIMRDTEVPILIAWITGRKSKAVQNAAENLGVGDLVQGSHDKRRALELILRKHRLSFKDAAFIGDDLIDLSVLKEVGFAACPSDATSDVVRHAHYVSPFAGGKGAVRDVIEFILKAQGRWDDVINAFLH